MHLEIGVPRGLLASGLVLIDTPGTDGQDPARNASIFAALARADLVLMVSDATRELSVTEMNLLLHVAQSHTNVVVVLSKIDMSPDWRAVAERNRRHVASAGVPVPLIPVSATLRLQAARTNDEVINAESGFPELITRLVQNQTSKMDTLARANVDLITRTVVEQLAAPLRAELSVQESPETSGPLSRLHEAQRAVEDLRRCATKWQNTLNDEMADLISDIEYDLRDRTRKIVRAVDEFFDSADPAAVWDGFDSWLEENMRNAAEANFAWLVARADWIARRIAAGFPEYRDGALPRSTFRVPPDAFDSVAGLEEPSTGAFGVGHKVFTGLRGSYGGLVMFGLLTSLAGFPLVNAVSLGAGALFGGKTLKDEGENRRLRRQVGAKQIVQRHIEDFFLKFSKDCRDVVRQAHRTLRDHFTAVAEEMQDMLIESARQAKQNADRGAAERSRRNIEIERELDALAALYGRVRTELVSA
jgi:Dynamin family